MTRCDWDFLIPSVFVPVCLSGRGDKDVDTVARLGE